MKKIIIYLFVLSFLPAYIYAQKIHISLPAESNKQYVFVLNKGIKQDTIQKGTVSFAGDIHITIPAKDKNYVGMGYLNIKGSEPINIIVNHENFEMTKDATNKFVFKNSKENTYLYSIMQERVTPQPDPTLYASSFIDIIRYVQQLIRLSNQGGSLADTSNARLYATKNLDMEKLYTSSLWYNVIDGLVKITPNQEMMGESMIQILKRIKSQEVFEHLADNLVVITDQFGLDDAFDIIIPYIKQSGRIPYPQGRMFTAFALAKVKKGSPAPALGGLVTPLNKSNASKTLLVFYQPDCDNCHIQLEQLIKEYPKLKQQGIRIISISSDSEKQSFENDKKRFPWANEDKLCDFKGFAGKNFIEYGIMGTPTYFLLDKNGNVIKRYALLENIPFSAN